MADVPASNQDRLFRTTQILEAADFNLNSQDGALKQTFARVNRAPSAGQFASQGDINIVRAEMAAQFAALTTALGQITSGSIDMAAVQKAAQDGAAKALADLRIVSGGQ
ncbi:MAG: hypothetical protein L0G87_01465 [Renibacterium salmoninarum]|nr:hypothetical protein [Renibacterium salmoninarum]